MLLSLSNNAVLLPSPPTRRSAEKRKGVRFADEEENEDDRVTSTAAFVQGQGAAWDTLANTFDCSVDVHGGDEAAVMEELLQLCWFGGKERVYEQLATAEEEESDEEDEEEGEEVSECESEEEEWLVNLRSHVDKQQQLTVSRRVVSPVDLRIRSQLRLTSVMAFPDLGRGDDGLDYRVASPPQPLADDIFNTSQKANELEDAFKGIIRDEPAAPISKPSNKDDFWADVEF